jgi:hypothetical protein
MGIAGSLREASYNRGELEQEARSSGGSSFSFEKILLIS